MKRLLLLAVLAAACAPRSTTAPATPARPADATAPIVATLDLTAVTDDRVPVTIDPGPFTQNEVLFRLPRVVQGTYAISNFGAYVDDLRAFDYEGREIPVVRADTNTWRIAGAQRLDRLSYDVNDTYDIEQTGGDAPFSPSGTNIAPDIYMLNLHGFVGYFEGMTETAYEVHIVAPEGMAHASALPQTATEPGANGRTETDVYRGARYFDITDNPLMYGDITTASFGLTGIEVTLAVYSPTKMYSATDFEPALRRMMQAQRAYLGDLETTDRYTIFLYLAQEGRDAPVGAGALEHHTSTVANFPESLPRQILEPELVHTISHEFFHIVSPLSVHSEDVHDFDYNRPTFSKHLWMYEGQTEYFANHFQVYEGLETRQEFYEAMADKIEAAAGFDDAMSFTEMSENITDEPYESNYLNVYQKGALIGMCLDILLREESGGSRSLIGFMKELSDRYGKERPFDDDRIIDIITDMTYPSIGRFLRTHVVGGTPIDYGTDCLAPAGVTVTETEVPTNLFFVSPQEPYINVDEQRRIYFRDIPFNTALVALGVQPNDILRSINGVAYDQDNIQALVQASVGWTPETQLQLVVEREGRDLTLSGPLGRPMRRETRLAESPTATPAQVAVRDAWLGPAR